MENKERNSEILFSVIIAVYNAESFLERTIQSVLHQSYRNFELWLIDDCSTDNSYRIAQEYANQYSQVHAIQLPVNSGSAQRPLEKGYELVKGEFVIGIGHDDEINEDYMAKMYEIVRNNPNVDIVVPSMQVVDSVTNKTIGAYPQKGVDTSCVLSGPDACRMTMPRWQFAANGMIVRRNLFGYIHDENPYTYSNSDELTSRILLYHARNVAFSKDSIYIYNQYSTSITHKRSVKLFETLYTDTHLILFAEKYFDEALASTMCSKMLINMKSLYKGYLLSKGYTLEEKQRINLIFSETYAFLRLRKYYLRSFRQQLFLSNWFVFVVLNIVMFIKKQIKSMYIK